MTIKRTINGKEMSFDLTSHELFDAFIEQEHQFDVESVKLYADEWKSDEGFMEDLHVTRRQFLDVIDDIAYRLRKYIGEYDMERWEAIECAMYDVLREHYYND